MVGKVERVHSLKDISSLMKPYGLAVCGDFLLFVDSGSALIKAFSPPNDVVSLSSQSDFVKPRFPCVHIISETNKRLNALVLVTDTNNHTVKASEYVFDREHKNQFPVRLNFKNFAGSSSMGGVNGAADSARFRFPLSIVSLQPFSPILIVCDTGNHCLRSISQTTTGWTVNLIAGVFGMAGHSDGHVGKDKVLLTSPACAFASVDEKVVYFTEQDEKRPNLRKFCPFTNKVTTVVSGAPFVYPTGICAGDIGFLLVTDPYAKCIWKVEISTGSVSNFISNEDFIAYLTVNDIICSDKR